MSRPGNTSHITDSTDSVDTPRGADTTEDRSDRGQPRPGGLENTRMPSAAERTRTLVQSTCSSVLLIPGVDAAAWDQLMPLTRSVGPEGDLFLELPADSPAVRTATHAEDDELTAVLEAHGRRPGLRPAPHPRPRVGLRPAHHRTRPLGTRPDDAQAGDERGVRRRPVGRRGGRTGGFPGRGPRSADRVRGRAAAASARGARRAAGDAVRAAGRAGKGPLRRPSAFRRAARAGPARAAAAAASARGPGAVLRRPLRIPRSGAGRQ